MGDPRCQLPDGLQFLGMEELDFHAGPLALHPFPQGNIAGHDGTDDESKQEEHGLKDFVPVNEVGHCP